MVGTLPRTRYLCIRYDMLLGEFESLYDIGKKLGISINDEGRITFRGSVVGPQYVLYNENDPWATRNGWEKEEALKDWCNHYIIGTLPPEYSIYRTLI